MTDRQNYRLLSWSDLLKLVGFFPLAFVLAACGFTSKATAPLTFENVIIETQIPAPSSTVSPVTETPQLSKTPTETFPIPTPLAPTNQPEPIRVIEWNESSVDVTERIEILGNPYQSKYPSGQMIFARNIWDMIAFNGELFIGAGNSSNVGPAQNAGPVQVYAFSPSTRQFRIAFNVDDEQIDVFRIFGDRLYIPGHDPIEEWEFGNFYRLDIDGVWRKYRNIPGGVHNYDMAESGGTLFAGISIQGGAAVAISRDWGDSWTVDGVAGNRIYSFLVDDQEIYAIGNRLPKSLSVSQYDWKGFFKPRNDIGYEKLFPGINPSGKTYCAKATRTVIFKQHSVYIGAKCHNDHQYKPFGVFMIKSLAVGNISVQQVRLPKDTRAWDLLVDHDVLYVLLDTPNADGSIVWVAASRDGITWTEVLNFQAKTFARSFAILNGDFYFGLGCEIEDPVNWNQQELPPEAGQILRLKNEYWLQIP